MNNDSDRGYGFVMGAIKALFVIFIVWPVCIVFAFGLISAIIEAF